MSADSNSRRAAVSGSRWGLLRSVAVQLANFSVTLVLARILVPGEFGLIAGTLSVVGLIELATELGFGASVVRSVKAENREISTLFWMALSLGLLAGTGLAVFAHPVSRLIGLPAAGDLVAFASLIIPLNMTGGIGRGLLIRSFRFRSVAFVEIAGTILYGVIAVSLALSGLGAWAMIIGRVGRSAAAAGAHMVLARFKPILVIDTRIFRQQVRFGSGYWVSETFRYLSKSIDYWAVGRVLGSEALGLYYSAYVLPNLLRQRLAAPAREVLFALISQDDDDPSVVVHAYSSAVKLVAVLVVPAMVGVAVLADVIIMIFFGPTWSDAALSMSVLAIAAAVSTVGSSFVPSVFNAMGTPLRNLWEFGTELVVLILGFGVAAHFGSIHWFAVVVLLGSLIGAAVGNIALARSLGVAIGDLVAGVWSPAIAAAAMAAAVILIRALVVTIYVELLVLAIAIVTGAITYAAALYLLDRPLAARAMRTALEIVGWK